MQFFSPTLTTRPSGGTQVFSGYSFSPGEVNVCVEPGEAFSQEAATPGAQSRFSADISTECMYNREYEKG